MCLNVKCIECRYNVGIFILFSFPPVFDLCHHSQFPGEGNWVARCRGNELILADKTGSREWSDQKSTRLPTDRTGQGHWLIRRWLSIGCLIPPAGREACPRIHRYIPHRTAPDILLTFISSPHIALTLCFFFLSFIFLFLGNPWLVWAWPGYSI